MFRVLLIAFIFVFGSSHSKSTMKGGTDAKWGQFSAVVSITTPEAGRLCTGNIYNSRHVITSAQCVVGQGNEKENPFWYKIVAGDISLTKQTVYRTEKNVTDIFVHKEFNPSTLENDIALIRTNTAFEFPHNTIEAAELNTRILESGTRCEIVGWNTVDERSTVINQHFIKAQILNHDQCAELHPGKIFESNLCAMGMGNVGICEDNTGSGLYCNGELVGILSTGQKCDKPLPTILTQLRFYSDWLEEQKSAIGDPDDRASPVL